jgi:NMD protein affecting ribosome stability and mRNA decay
MKCQVDDCDQVHCAKCGEHTVGNTLIAGLCQGCYDIAEAEYNRQMQQQYEAAIYATQVTL